MSAAGERLPPDCTVVILGASGDLTRRKLVPAFYNLARQGLLPARFHLLGVARRELDERELRASLREHTAELVGDGLDPALWERFQETIHYQRGDFGRPADFDALAARLAELGGGSPGNVLFYMATAPEHFSGIVGELCRAGLGNEADGWRRVVVEKPFGRDLTSARQLNKDLRTHLDERQIYRIDHYLGKETVQNLLVFRFSNGIFEPIWNRRYVDHVQITVAETLGIEGRGGYYDTAGALRDMVPNHIFQLVSLVAMEPPISFDADAVRDEQSKVLRAVQPISPEEVLERTVRGQYGAGETGGARLPAYRDEERVREDSPTETFVAMRLEIDNWRWKDVPFYLRVGKALPRRLSEITVQFKRPPFMLFRNTPVDSLARNRLVINVQPDEGITLQFSAKVPGAQMAIGGVDMNFSYAEHFGHESATGYERLLYDAMLGDQTLFQREDMVLASWAAVETTLDVWKALPPRGFPNYVPGSWGPAAADELLARDGRTWFASTPRERCP